MLSKFGCALVALFALVAPQADSRSAVAERVMKLTRDASWKPVTSIPSIFLLPPPRPGSRAHPSPRFSYSPPAGHGEDRGNVLRDLGGDQGADHAVSEAGG